MELEMPTGRSALRFVLLVGGALVPLLQGCSSEGEITSLEGTSTVTLQFEGLEPLTGGMSYQAWAIAGTQENPWGFPVVIFNIDENGDMVDPVTGTVLTGSFEAGIDAQAVFGIAVSLEAATTLQTHSSFSFIVGGQLVGGSASMSTAHWIAFDGSLAATTGTLVLGTPTDEDPENETSGVWFLDPTGPATQAGLDLPDAPSGWNYESWVVLGDQSLSMGKFFLPEAADSTATYSGTLPGPGFPGEDFLTGAPAGLTFPVDLSGASVLVTMEPWAEWDFEPDAPFFLTLLETQIPADAAPETLYQMTSRVNELPTGTATIQSS